ncbi:GLPGLI family protein [Mucilaginibacter agri]|uniref:GLPGLI family protein n=1 Tax=Mucilaginibacter agri TaxID=2695265 RepID=A0A965ZDX1_9SPHI|nr:GLPGLI family protein [Mucilaginibacter agri]NCD69030.1 GLPGLI family protein [Mucilaginibacter agri]
MKPKHIILSALLLAAKATFAQKADTAKLIVHYQFTHVRDTLNKDKPYTENMMLLVGANASVYKSLDRKLRSAQMQADLAKQMKESAGGPQNFNVNMKGNAGTTTEYFYFLNEHKAFRKEQVFNSYIIEEPAVAPQWKISNDTLTIGGYHCQKASTHFKGRDYTAWFCADLPFHAGPWKLNGLPGLILQAADTKNEIVFKFDGTETVDTTVKTAVADAAPMPGVKVFVLGDANNGNGNIPDYMIALPEKGIRSTEKELARLKEMRDKDPQAFIQSAVAGSGMVVPGGQGPVIKIQSAPNSVKPVNNNPIELDEKK